MNTDTTTTAEQKLVMQVLLQAIEAGNPISYGETTRRAREINPALGEDLEQLEPHYRLAYVLDELNRRVQNAYPDAPTISAMVVNQETNVPGDGITGFPGFGGYKGKKDDEKVEMATRAWKAVSDYTMDKWQAIYADLFE